MKTMTKFPFEYRREGFNSVCIFSEDKTNLLESWREVYKSKDNAIKLDYNVWHAIKNHRDSLYFTYIQIGADNKIVLTLHNSFLSSVSSEIDFDIDDNNYTFGNWIYELFFKSNFDEDFWKREYYCVWGKDNTQLSDYSTWLNSSGTAPIINTSGTVSIINNNNNNEIKGDSKMNGFNFDFGPCNENNVRISIYGIAIKNVAGEWVSYNPDAKEIVNVDIFNFENGGKYLYKIPVAITDIAIGDVVIHNKVPMFVNAVNADGTLSVTDVREGEAKNIILTKNMFGFNFATKVVSLFAAFGQAPTPDQPFGNMLPLMLLNNEGDIDPLLILAMTQKDNKMFANPMMLYCLMNKSGNSDNLLPLMMLSSGNFNF